jgi:hypothetical protein
MNLNYKDILTIAGVVLVMVIIGSASYDGVKKLMEKKPSTDTTKS